MRSRRGVGVWVADAHGGRISCRALWLSHRQHGHPPSHNRFSRADPPRRAWDESPNEFRLRQRRSTREKRGGGNESAENINPHRVFFFFKQKTAYEITR